MILKSSLKYIILKKDNLVYKISKQKNKTNILKEYKLLKKLSNDVRYLNLLPKLYKIEKIKFGIFKGNYFYRQNFIKGQTFSNEVKNKRYNYIKSLFLLVSKKFIFICQNAKKDANINQANFIKKIFQEELKLIKKNTDLNSLISAKKIIINNKKYNSLSDYLNKIFSSYDYRQATKYFKICKNEHWNFHGDNVLIDKNDVKIIDPDTSIDFNDSFFSFSRFLYSYIHDTCFYKKYLIETTNFIFCKKQYKFRLKTIWSSQANKNYSILSKFINENKYSNNIFIKKLNLNYYDVYRIKIMYLYCLVRGINRNYQKTYTYPGKNVKHIQIDHVYLYLQSVMYAKNFLEFHDNER